MKRCLAIVADGRGSASPSQFDWCWAVSCPPGEARIGSLRGQAEPWVRSALRKCDGPGGLGRPGVDHKVGRVGLCRAAHPGSTKTPAGRHNLNVVGPAREGR